MPSAARAWRNCRAEATAAATDVNVGWLSAAHISGLSDGSGSKTSESASIRYSCSSAITRIGDGFSTPSSGWVATTQLSPSRASRTAPRSSAQASRW